MAKESVERSGDRGSHRAHRTVPLIENTSLNQDQTKTKRVDEFPYLLWRTKHLRRCPNHPNGEILDPDTSLPISTWETVPVDIVSWGTKDTYLLLSAMH